MAKLEHFQLFETVSMMYLVGSDRSEVRRRRSSSSLAQPCHVSKQAAAPDTNSMLLLLPLLLLLRGGRQSQFRILRMNKRLPVTARTRLADVVREVSEEVTGGIMLPPEDGFKQTLFSRSNVPCWVEVSGPCLSWSSLSLPP